MMPPLALDISKISEWILQPEMSSRLIRKKFWHSSLNVSWTHFPLIRNKNLDWGNFDELQSSSETGTNLQCWLHLEKKVWGIIHPLAHTLSFLILFCPKYLWKVFSFYQYRKEDVILNFCLNFARNMCLSESHLLI